MDRGGADQRRDLGSVEPGDQHDRPAAQVRMDHVVGRHVEEREGEEVDVVVGEGPGHRGVEYRRKQAAMREARAPRQAGRAAGVDNPRGVVGVRRGRCSRCRRRRLGRERREFGDSAIADRGGQAGGWSGEANTATGSTSSISAPSSCGVRRVLPNITITPTAGATYIAITTSGWLSDTTTIRSPGDATAAILPAAATTAASSSAKLQIRSPHTNAGAPGLTAATFTITSCNSIPPSCTTTATDLD